MDSFIDPEDMDELSNTYYQMMRDNDKGYVLEFSISRLQAKDMMKIWTLACIGESESINQCLVEFGKIMLELNYALETDTRY